MSAYYVTKFSITREGAAQTCQQLRSVWPMAELVLYRELVPTQSPRSITIYASCGEYTSGSYRRTRALERRKAGGVGRVMGSSWLRQTFTKQNKTQDNLSSRRLVRPIQQTKYTSPQKETRSLIFKPSSQTEEKGMDESREEGGKGSQRFALSNLLLHVYTGVRERKY